VKKLNKQEIDDEKYIKLLNDAHNCKLTDSYSLLTQIESELQKNKDNKTILRAKRVLTTRRACNGIIS